MWQELPREAFLPLLDLRKMHEKALAARGSAALQHLQRLPPRAPIIAISMFHQDDEDFEQASCNLQLAACNPN